MQSRNPVIKRAEAQYAGENSGPGFAAIDHGGPGAPPPSAPGSVPPGQLRDMYNAPSTAGPTGVAMTIHDVIMKTSLGFVILVLAAAGSWFFIGSTVPATAPAGSISGVAWGVMIGGALIAFGLAMVNIFKRNISPALVLAYAVFEGVFLGGISYVFQIYGEQLGYGSLVITAVIATFVVFAVMLTLYTKRIIKVTNKFKKIMVVSMISYLGFAVISMIAGMFGVGGGLGFFGFGWIGVGVSLLVVIMASFALCLDFDAVEQGIRYQVPERESWRMAFGLMVTVVWLYMEILRLLLLVANASR